MHVILTDIRIEQPGAPLPLTLRVSGTFPLARSAREGGLT